MMKDIIRDGGIVVVLVVTVVADLCRDDDDDDDDTFCPVGVIVRSNLIYSKYTIIPYRYVFFVLCCVCTSNKTLLV